jgi:hypothetical protein
MQRLEVSGAVRPVYGSLSAKGLNCTEISPLIGVGDEGGGVNTRGRTQRIYSRRFSLLNP